MNAINLVKIKSRIIFLVLIPLVATLFLALGRLNDANTAKNNIEQLELLLEYVSKVSPVITGLQEERLRSSFYIESRSEDAAELAELKQKLTSSRAPTNKALDAYLDFIADKEKLAEFPLLLKDITTIEENIAMLDLARTVADKKLRNMPHPDPDNSGKVWPLGTLRVITDNLVNSTMQVVVLSASNAELSLLANAYQNLISAKNSSIQLFDSVTQGIIVTVNGSRFGGIIKLKDVEKLHVDTFASFAPTESVNFFNTELRQQEFYKYYLAELEKIRRKATKQIGAKIESDLTQWLETGEQIKVAYDESIDQVLEQIQASKDQQLGAAQAALINTILIIIGLLVVLAAVSSLIVSSINTPLKQLIDVLNNLADSKDMSIRSDVKGNNELTFVGAALNTLIESFESTLSKVRARILSMDDTTKNVSSLMQDSMKLIDSQRDATDNISVAINEMTTTIHEVSNLTSTTSDTVQRAYELSITGEKDAQVSKTAMNELFTELGETSGLVSNLNEEAAQISNILQVIKGISEQTNLLALNAAIEAARAGEMGRGFAVVADEVRSLSMRTQDSTEQIQAQIETLINGADAASKKMAVLQENGEQAVDIVQKTTNSFITIKSELDQITDMAAQIATSAEEQSSVANEINERIYKIKDDSENMYDQGNQTLASTEELLKNGSDLRENIDVFRFD